MNRTHLSHKLPLIANIPVSVDEVREDILNAEREAKASSNAVLISYAGMYDILVHPSGSFSFISTEVPVYVLNGKYVEPQIN